MKVLIVDDEIDKATAIVQAFAEAGVVPSSIIHHTNASAARSELQRSRFDLLIVDIRIPSILGQNLSDRGGFDFLDMLKADSNASIPAEVLFITGRDELVGLARTEAANRGAVLLEFSKPAVWRPLLIGKANWHKLSGTRTPNCSMHVALITALNSPEFEAVQNLPYNWRPHRYVGDPTQYHFGQVSRSDIVINVVAACASRKGMPSSSALAAKMVSTFSPRYLIMAGICAGIEGKVSFGDVVVGDPTWDYGSGKRALQDDGSPVFQVAPYQAPLDPEIRAVAELISRDTVLLRSIKANWPGNTPEGILRAVVAPMASGASVLADNTIAREAFLQQRDLTAIEMEAYGVMAAVEYATAPKPLAVVVKSVCDFADPEKRDKWQAYAAYTSAAFVDQLLRHPNLRL